MFQVKEPKEQERKSICRYYLKIYENEPDDISQIKIEEHIYPRVPSIKRRGNKQTMQDTHEGRTYLVSSQFLDKMTEVAPGDKNSRGRRRRSWSSANIQNGEDV